MKTFHLFVGDDYYPRGGSNDHYSSHETEEEAEEAGVAYTELHNSTWWATAKTLPDGSLEHIAEGSRRYRQPAKALMPP